ncbi:MAG: zinc ABC transporter substrate-binding protein [Clostridia bacterium]|nr:zinc ABC transporter substrate-binding protein [Clostridia bacterium]
MKKGLSFIIVTVLFLSTCLFFVSIKSNNENNSDKIKIVATLFPQYDFAKQIGGDKVEVSLLLTPGTETHTYEPTPQDIIRINNSDLFVYTGKYMEPWSERIAMSIDSNTKILDASKNINLIKSDHDEDEHEDSEAHEEDVDEHEEEQHHEHEHVHEFDPHIWLNPQNAVQMVKNITEELCKISPENAEYFNNNANNYIKQIEELDSEAENIIKESGKNKVAFGGAFAYAYFIDRYKLEYVSAYDSCGEDTEPSVANVKKVIDYMNQNSLKVIFYQELSSGRIADSIAKETNSKKLVFHTVHNASQDEINRGETYVSLMRKNIENLKEALK